MDGGSSLIVLRLYCSSRLLPGYNNFRNTLKRYLPLLNESTLLTTGGEAIHAILKVLRAERKREMVVADRDGMNDGIRAFATDQDDMTDKPGQPRRTE